MIFYSPSTGGFYDSRLHGERTLRIPAPEWQRPLVTLTLQPGGATSDGAVVNESEQSIEIEVPDESTEHPLIEAPNPNCLLPADALEITPKRHAELLAGNAQGQLIIADENGHPSLQAPPPPTAEQLSTQATAMRAQLLQSATLAIAPLQDAVDLGEASEYEEVALTAWKRYRVQLNRIEQQDSYPNAIEWPVPPN
ncbi:tail fiber assembly protein [Pseudomonas sp. D2-3]